jgi:gas vesicle protein
MDLNDSIQENKDRLLKENERLNGELKEMGKERFEYLKDICDEIEVPTKYCKKIVNRNIKDCLKAIKQYIASIKTETKKIREEIKTANKFKTEELKKIADKIAKHPEEFESYKNSTYFTLRNKCSFRITTIKDLRDQFDEYPEVKALNETIQKQEDAIEMLKNQLIVIKDAYRLKVRELRTFIKTGNLSEMERDVVYRTLRDLQGSHKKTLKVNRKSVRQDILEAESVIKQVEGEKKKVYGTNLN